MSRFSWSGKGVWFLGSLALMALVARAAAPKATDLFVPELESFTPQPALMAAAAERGIVIEGFAPAAGAGDRFVVGDRVTALVTMRDGEKLTQWLVETTCAELTPEEKALPSLRNWTFYSNAGTEIVLGGTRAALGVRVLGPFDQDGRAGPEKITEQRARVGVNADFLSLGLEQACEAVLTVNAAKAADPALVAVNWGMRLQPYPPENVAEMRRRADALGLTPERERALAGTVPVLQEFFRIASRTPGLNDILKRVIDVPWWKVVTRGGDVPVGMMPQYNLALRLGSDPRYPAAGASGSIYTVPVRVTIAGEPALVAKLALVNPQRPLLACAGIVGLAASAPNGDGPRVTLHVIATRRGD